MTDQLTHRSVQDLITGSVRLAHASMCLRDAAMAMSEDEIGLLVVEGRDGQLAGVVSERDLVHALARGSDLDSDRLDSRMSDQVLTIDAEAPVSEALQAMVDADVRHLVVLDDTRRPAGVVSARDVMRSLGEAVGAGATG